MKLILNSNAIQADTGKAILIKLPKSDFCFWMPSRMVRTSGKNGYQLSVWFPNDSWEIKAQRTSDKTHKVLDEKVYSPTQLAEAYNIKLWD